MRYLTQLQIRYMSVGADSSATEVIMFFEHCLHSGSALFYWVSREPQDFGGVNTYNEIVNSMLSPGSSRSSTLSEQIP